MLVVIYRQSKLHCCVIWVISVKLVFFVLYYSYYFINKVSELVAVFKKFICFENLSIQSIIGVFGSRVITEFS